MEWCGAVSFLAGGASRAIATNALGKAVLSGALAKVAEAGSACVTVAFSRLNTRRHTFVGAETLLAAGGHVVLEPSFALGLPDLGVGGITTGWGSGTVIAVQRSHK